MTLSHIKLRMLSESSYPTGAKSMQSKGSELNDMSMSSLRTTGADRTTPVPVYSILNIKNYVIMFLCAGDMNILFV